MAKSLVIFLHGVGSSGADLGALAPLMQPGLPDTAFTAPDAPYAFDPGGPGRQWFSIAGVSEANRPARVLAARPAFDAVLTAVMAAHGLEGQPGRVALVGFSQGSIMALDALASGRWPVAGIVAFSGRLATAAPLAPPRGTRTLLIHGMADGVIPDVCSVSAGSELRAAGADIGLHQLPSVGHTISPEGLRLATAFLADALREA